MKNKIIEIIGDNQSNKLADIKARRIIVLYNGYILSQARVYLKSGKPNQSNAIASLIIDVL